MSDEFNSGAELLNDTKDDIYNLIEYLLFDGQIKIGEQGFIPMKPWKTR